MRPKLRALWHYRPRILTLVVAVPTVLANLTSEWAVGHARAQEEYGWPCLALGQREGRLCVTTMFVKR